MARLRMRIFRLCGLTIANFRNMGLDMSIFGLRRLPTATSGLCGLGMFLASAGEACGSLDCARGAWRSLDGVSTAASAATWLNANTKSEAKATAPSRHKAPFRPADRAGLEDLKCWFRSTATHMRPFRNSLDGTTEMRCQVNRNCRTHFSLNPVNGVDRRPREARPNAVGYIRRTRQL